MGNVMNLEQLYEHAQLLIGQNEHDEAYKILKKLDVAAPNHPGILYLLGICQSKSGNKQNAIRTYRRVLVLMPDFVEVMNNLGLDLLDQKGANEALNWFERAIAIQPNFAEAHINKSAALIDLNRLEDAHSLLVSLRKSGHRLPGLDYNLGNALFHMGFFKEALQNLLAAEQLTPDDEKVQFLLGCCFERLKQPLKAIKYFESASKIDPANDGYKSRIVLSRLQLCDWTENIFGDQELDRTSKSTTNPLIYLSLSDSAKNQQQMAENYTLKLGNGSIQRTQPRNRIRIGYFSSDIRDHAVSFLTAGLFEAHDRDKFEIHLFTFDPQPSIESSYKQRIVSHIEHLHVINSQSNEEVIKFARSIPLDIAVDLNGHTAHARTELFGCRVAPVQIQYLGFPGTMGASCIDYTIGDATVIPECYRYAYSEKIIYVPECFQVNDDKRLIDKTASRSDLGLPETGFIFACFNQASKITPTVFEHWMNILKATPDSFLWLAEENPEQVVNLREHAKNRDVSGERLIFAGRLPYASHLGRYRHADLVLDTFPFNGGTTTSDALWGGAPVITYPGEAYASRMAASLLRSVELDELITESLDAYEALAIKLASNPIKLNELRQRLHNHLSSAPVFNTKRFTRHFEKGLELAVERSRNGLKPDHIFVPLLAE